MQKRVMRWTVAVFACVVTLGAGGVIGNEPLVLTPVFSTSPLYSYEGAPATPDADDPAIWLNRGNPQRSLLIGTGKDAGLLVYDMSGVLRQALRPPNAPQVLPDDPDTPSGDNLLPDNPCADSESQETFGRFNNADIAYDVRLGSHPHDRVDVVIVSDRGCDRVRFYKIDLSDPAGPLVDITAPDVPRVFPTRYEQPSSLQPSGAVEGWRDNPVDDQNTVYGLTVAQSDINQVFVSQRERGLVRQLKIVSAPGGKLTYQVTRTFLFRTSFELKDEHGFSYDWTPCREAAVEEPQSEGVLFDVVNETLYVAFETIGLYKLSVHSSTPQLVTITGDDLLEPVKSFGQAYRAIPDGGEFECVYNPDGEPNPGELVSAGSPVNAGEFLEADLEGLSLIASRPGQALILASSQGDSSFHFYEISETHVAHRGVFFVDGVGDTDGVQYVRVPLGRQFPMGLLVVQNGEAPEPENTEDINGYEFDGATQFMYVNFAEARRAMFR
jgi:3-phytase